MIDELVGIIEILNGYVRAQEGQKRVIIVREYIMQDPAVHSLGPNFLRRMQKQFSNQYTVDESPLPFHVYHTDIIFNIESKEKTVVVDTILQFERVKGVAGTALVLNGKDINLVDISLNGKGLQKGTDYEVCSDPYNLDCQLLIIFSVPESGIVSMRNILKPWDNKSCAGLYVDSDGHTLLTQNEPEGCRQIFYTIDRPDNRSTQSISIYADDHKKYPILLANGNGKDVYHQAYGKGKAFAYPYPNSSYTFALYAGDPQKIEDTYVTGSGRRIPLRIFAPKEYIAQTKFGLEMLKQSLKLDEKLLGLEYPLEEYNIVAAKTFEAGAMENPQLNVYATDVIAGMPSNTVDTDLKFIATAVSHEAGHTWFGDVVTIANWRQLTAKEGAATYIENLFMSHTFGSNPQRIKVVRELINIQFPLDRSPLKRAVVPDNLDSLAGIYNTTTYTKGAELLETLKNVVGEVNFNAGFKKYITDNKGKAVMVKDLVRAVAEATKQADPISILDIAKFVDQFMLWYTVPGTPEIAITTDFANGNFTINIKQNTEKPFLIPVKIGLLSSDTGTDLIGTETLLMYDKEQTFSFSVPSEMRAPVLSLLRGFSAPVTVKNTKNDYLDQLVQAGYDSDQVARFLALENVRKIIILNMIKAHKAGQELRVPDELLEIYKLILNDPALDSDLETRALLLQMPSAATIIDYSDDINIDAIVAVRKVLMQTITRRFEDQLLYIYEEVRSKNETDGGFTKELIARRAMQNLCLNYLTSTEKYINLSNLQFSKGVCMTDIAGAFANIVTQEYPAKESAVLVAFRDFKEKFQADPLAMITWYTMQGLSTLPSLIDDLRMLKASKDFDITDPHMVQNVFRTFALYNVANFHSANGEGYRLVVDVVLELDLKVKNSTLSSELLEVFRPWYKLSDSKLRNLAQQQLLRVVNEEAVSEDCKSVARKLLATAPKLAPASMLLLLKSKASATVTPQQTEDMNRDSCRDDVRRPLLTSATSETRENKKRFYCC